MDLVLQQFELTGDVTMTNAGVVTIQNNTVTVAKLADAAEILIQY